MRTMKHLERLAILCAAILPAATAFHGCSDKKRSTVTTTTNGPAVQVERLGRPAVGEGLLISNEFLLAFNQIPPDQDLAVYTGTTQFSTDFRTQVRTVLGAVDDAVAPAGDVNDADVEQAFFPDVMRIDTSLDVPVGTAAYAFGAVPVGTVVRPIAGRKLEDDVIDITLFVLGGVGAPAPLSDNVDYADTHAMLNGQSAYGGAATFPFLAPPN